MPPHKRQKHSPVSSDDTDDQASVAYSEASFTDGDQSNTDNDDDDIQAMKPQKSKQTSKRKIRATGNSRFGATLEHLLQTDAPSTLPLSLKPSIARKKNDELLEKRAKKVLQLEKKDREDKAHITDVIGGWGGESERALRKVAQRGVVRLFNVIQQSQAQASAATEDAKANRGSGKPTLFAPVVETLGSKKGKNKSNVLGRGKELAVDKDDFFNMIRTGGVVSKA